LLLAAALFQATDPFLGAAFLGAAFLGAAFLGAAFRAAALFLDITVFLGGIFFFCLCLSNKGINVESTLDQSQGGRVS
tara:strand:+ start:2823 stop:3056 length:234 start_codon:yes stop_codon:yes gene_type:complete